MNRLSDAQITEHLAALPDWHREGEMIAREYERSSFAAAIAFVNDLARLAEQADHHPDLLVHGYKHVRVILSTHSAGGLTERDFALAAKIDAIS